MRLCMFHPLERPMERGWVGRLDGEQVTHLAAQTLQSFFLGGGGAREHAEYPLADVGFLAPVLHPPTVRVFDSQDAFGFANANAIVSPGVSVQASGSLAVAPRLAAVIGAEQQLGGFTGLVEWRAPDEAPPKDRDFALVLGPIVVTPDDLDPGEVDVAVRGAEEVLFEGRLPSFAWEKALELAGRGTELRPGDIVAGPSISPVGVDSRPVALELTGIGTVRSQVAGN